MKKIVLICAAIISIIAMCSFVASKSSDDVVFYVDPGHKYGISLATGLNMYKLLPTEVQNEIFNAGCMLEEQINNTPNIHGKQMLIFNGIRVTVSDTTTTFECDRYKLVSKYSVSYVLQSIRHI